MKFKQKGREEQVLFNASSKLHIKNYNLKNKIVFSLGRTRRPRGRHLCRQMSWR
jgi:hypothetical protein